MEVPAFCLSSQIAALDLAGPLVWIGYRESDWNDWLNQIMHQRNEGGCSVSHPPSLLVRSGPAFLKWKQPGRRVGRARIFSRRLGRNRRSLEGHRPTKSPLH